MAQTITITIDLAAINKAASTEIWKWGQANKDDANYQRIYHMQHSDADNVDNALLTIYVMQRAERIAEFVSEYLTGLEYETNNHIQIDTENQYDTTLLPSQRNQQPQYIVYELILPCGWNNLTCNSLERHFNEYVIDGSVADWFTNIGEKQGAVFEQQATVASTNIIRNIYKKNSTI
jgi:hypothetical protein